MGRSMIDEAWMMSGGGEECTVGYVGSERQEAQSLTEKSQERPPGIFKARKKEPWATRRAVAVSS
jgi:hypothetical protein